MNPSDAANIVTQLYQQYLGRSPDPGSQGYIDALVNGWQDVALVTSEISGSQEANAYRANVVTQLYQQYLGRNPDPGWQGYLDALANGSQTVALVTAEISGSQEANAYAAAQARSKGAAPNTTPSPPYVFAPGAVGVTPTGQPIYPPGYVPPAAPTPSPPPTPPTATPTPPAPIPTAAPAPAPHLLPRSLFSGGDGPDFGSYCAFYPEDPYCALANDLGPFFSGIPNSPQIINNTVVVGSGLLAADVHAIVNDALSGLWGVVVGTLDLVLGRKPSRTSETRLRRRGTSFRAWPA
jgi:hypothetical protein